MAGHAKPTCNCVPLSGTRPDQVHLSASYVELFGSEARWVSWLAKGAGTVGLLGFLV